MRYLKDLEVVQAGIFCAWKSQKATGGEGAGGVGSTGGQADDQRTRFSASRLRENYLGTLELQWSARVGQEENNLAGSLSETDGTGKTDEGSEFLELRTPNFGSRLSGEVCPSRACEAGGLFQHPATVNFSVLCLDNRVDVRHCERH